jgi:hypothetical protein
MPHRDRGFRRFRALEPGSWFKTASVEEYVRLYSEHLSKLDAAEVVRDLERMAGGLIPVLLCFEPPEPGTKWCHRGLVSKWLAKELSIEVYELGQEHEGFGAAHPKVPEQYRVVRPAQDRRSS